MTCTDIPCPIENPETVEPPDEQCTFAVNDATPGDGPVFGGVDIVTGEPVGALLLAASPYIVWG